MNAAQLAAKGYALESGDGERVQRWRSTAEGSDVLVVFDSVAGRAVRVESDADARIVAAILAVVAVIENGTPNPTLDAALAAMSCGRV